ncbi:MAG: ATP-binding protein [Gallionella sp.]|nr:ATP-binding protein [Gallionella sp.]
MKEKINVTPKLYNFLQQALQQLIHLLIKMSSRRFIALFLIVAVLVSVLIVLTIDFLWDGRFNTELEFAGIVTPFLDGLFLVLFVTAMFDEIRREVERRKAAEESFRKLTEELESRVQTRTVQLLATQEELVRTEKLALLGQVADTVGHELRNPLGVMNNAVYFLQAVLPDADETVREYLGIIKDEITDAERIVSDLLDAVRTKPPQPTRVEVAELLRQALRKCPLPALVTVQMEIPDTLPAILADPAQMHQVLWNLMTNAVEAMPGGGVLKIKAAADPAANTVSISIKDSGSGIAPEQQCHLFEPLFTTKARRIGLGLVVVKNLTEANGGSVSVKSEPAKGSVFTVTLPKG